MGRSKPTPAHSKGQGTVMNQGAPTFLQYRVGKQPLVTIFHPHSGHSSITFNQKTTQPLRVYMISSARCSSICVVDAWGLEGTGHNKNPTLLVFPSSPLLGVSTFACHQANDRVSTHKTKHTGLTINSMQIGTITCRHDVNEKKIVQSNAPAMSNFDPRFGRTMGAARFHQRKGGKENKK